MRNQGVTVNWWDRVLGTLDEPEIVKVPRRLAPKWMIGPDGELLDTYRADYVLIGAARTTTETKASEDHDRAYANLIPIP